MRALLPALLLVVSAPAAADSLGKIEFPVTGTPQARTHFVRGVLALHSFFYDEALDEFRAATRIEPGFAMGYWGEAMAHNHTIWDQQDTEAARAALAKIGDVSGLTAKERGFIEAVRALYGKGDKPARDRAYELVLERMAAEDPDDQEVATFLALALIGIIPADDPGLALRMRAGAIALEVLAKNPDHPGAAHYAIHAFDDADHARIALPAALRYAQIAPAAYHARHMPAHIFVNLGMWDAAAAANESAWAASEEWVARRGHSSAKKDFHSLEWMVLIYHQQGRLKKAEETLARFAQIVADTGEVSVAGAYVYTVGSFIERTGGWDRVDALLAPAEKAVKEANAAGPGCHATPKGLDKLFLSLGVARLRAAAAAWRGDAAGVDRQLATAAEWQRRIKDSPAGASVAQAMKIRDLAMRATLARAQKRYDEADAKLREAIALSLRSSYRGAADPGGYALETMRGDLLMAAGKPVEAAAAYRDALRVTPGDSLALLGAARAARKRGDEAGAAVHYARLAAQWKDADAGFPGLDEVRAGAKSSARAGR